MQTVIGADSADVLQNHLEWKVLAQMRAVTTTNDSDNETIPNCHHDPQM